MWNIFFTLVAKASPFQLYCKEGVNSEWNYCEAGKIRLFPQATLLEQAETKQLIHKDQY